MKLIFAIIQPTKLVAVREALKKIDVTRMTICDVQGYVQRDSGSELLQIPGRKATLLRKIALEIVVNDDFLERTIDVITNVARTGRTGVVGDGAIFVMPTEEAIQINDSVTGPGAV